MYGSTVLIFVPPMPLLSIFKRVVLSGTVLELMRMDFTPMKYSVDFSPAEKTPAVLTGLMKSGVYVRESVRSMLGKKWYGPLPAKITPGNLVEPLRQTANFLLKLKAAENWDGREIPFRPNPAIPVTPPARPSRRNVDPQTKRKFGTVTGLVGLNPSVEETETISEASSPLVDR